MQSEPRELAAGTQSLRNGVPKGTQSCVSVEEDRDLTRLTSLVYNSLNLTT